MSKGRKVLIRRLASGDWIVVRPGYGFSPAFTITSYPSWAEAIRSVQFVGIGSGAAIIEQAASWYRVRA